MNRIFKTAKPDSRILILQVVIVSILSFSFSNWIALLLLFLVIDALTGYFLSLKNGIKFLITFIVTLCVQRILTMIYIPVVSSVLAMFLVLFIKAIPVYMVLLILIKRTPMNELIAALRKIHIPMILLIPMSVMYRYIPTIRQECVYIHESLIMRGLHSSARKIFQNPLGSVEHYLVPLLFRSEQITEELSAATLCKGLDVNRERTCCTEVKLQTVDYLYAIIFFVISFVLVYVNTNLLL